MFKRSLFVVPAVLSLAGCTLQLGSPQPASVIEVRVPEKAPAAVLPERVSALPERETRHVLTTTDFESGRYTMTDASSDSLEVFLRDLNRRKDYDYLCNNGQPGPNSAFLWQWVQNVVTELQSRGYYFDDSGDFHRPSTVVAIR